MQISSRLSRIKAPATLAMNAAALELKAKGVEVISLAAGEPDFSPPPHVCKAIKDAVDAGHTHYTDVAGIKDLRLAVAHQYAEKYDVSADENNIIICNGGKQALYNLFIALLEPKDEVIIPAPYWVSYPEMAHLAEAVPVHVFAGPEQNFKINTAQLESVRTKRSRVLIYNSPSNPTGAVYTEKERDAIFSWAMEHNIFVIADEMYDSLVYPPSTMSGACSKWKEFPDKVALINGFSKSFAMTGLRIGYALAHPDIIKAMIRFQGQATANVCSIAQYGALAAVNGNKSCLITMRNIFKKRMEIAFEEISSWQGIICPKPDGAFYIFADIRAFLNSDTKDCVSLCSRLLNEAHVATVPGISFGAPGFIRFSCAISEDKLQEALRRIKTILYA